MGWASGKDVFEPVAEIINEELKIGHISYDCAENILIVLIAALQSADWDTEDESLRELRAHPHVVAAFRERGISLDPVDDGD